MFLSTTVIPPNFIHLFFMRASPRKLNPLRCDQISTRNKKKYKIYCVQLNIISQQDKYNISLNNSCRVSRARLRLHAIVCIYFDPEHTCPDFVSRFTISLVMRQTAIEKTQREREKEKVLPIVSSELLRHSSLFLRSKTGLVRKSS